MNILYSYILKTIILFYFLLFFIEKVLLKEDIENIEIFPFDSNWFGHYILYGCQMSRCSRVRTFEIQPLGTYLLQLSYIFQILYETSFPIFSLSFVMVSRYHLMFFDQSYIIFSSLLKFALKCYFF